MPTQGEKIKETVVLILLNIGLPSVDVGSDIALMIKFYIGSRSNLWCDEKYKYSDNQFLNCYYDDITMTYPPFKTTVVTYIPRTTPGER